VEPSFFANSIVTRREAAAAWDSATLHVKDVEDRAVLVEREALERVSRAEAEKAVVLDFAHEDAKGFACKVTLLEDKLAAEHQAREVCERERREQFKELSLLQTRGSELYHANVGPPRAGHHLSEGMWLAALYHTEMVG
jgi:hypothetical protein